MLGNFRGWQRHPGPGLTGALLLTLMYGLLREIDNDPLRLRGWRSWSNDWCGHGTDFALRPAEDSFRWSTCTDTLRPLAPGYERLGRKHGARETDLA